MVAVKGPSAAAEADYVHSVVSATSAMRERLTIFTKPEARLPVPGGAAAFSATLGPADPNHPLPNRDLDTGQVVKPGGYSLTDKTYANLLHRLTRDPSQPIPPGIKSDVQAYYSDPNAPITTKQHQGEWDTVQADLKTLATMPTSAAAKALPHLWGVEQSNQVAGHFKCSGRGAAYYSVLPAKINSREDLK